MLVGEIDDKLASNELNQNEYYLKRDINLKGSINVPWRTNHKFRNMLKLLPTRIYVDPSVRWKLQSFDVGQRERRGREGKKSPFHFKRFRFSIPTCNSRTCLNWKATRFVQLFVTRNIYPNIWQRDENTHSVAGRAPKSWRVRFPSLSPNVLYRSNCLQRVHETWTEE